jgi:hypothetical protein
VRQSSCYFLLPQIAQISQINAFLFYINNGRSMPKKIWVLQLLLALASNLRDPCDLREKETLAQEKFNL